MALLSNDRGLCIKASVNGVASVSSGEVPVEPAAQASFLAHLAEPVAAPPALPRGPVAPVAGAAGARPAGGLPLGAAVAGVSPLAAHLQAQILQAQLLQQQQQMQQAQMLQQQRQQPQMMQAQMQAFAAMGGGHGATVQPAHAAAAAAQAGGAQAPLASAGSGGAGGTGAAGGLPGLLTVMVETVGPKIEKLFHAEYDELWTDVVAEPPPWDAGRLAFVIHKHWRSMLKKAAVRDVEEDAEYLSHFCKRHVEGRGAPLPRAVDAAIKAGKVRRPARLCRLLLPGIRTWRNA